MVWQKTDWFSERKNRLKTQFVFLYDPRWFCGCCWWTWTLPTWNPDRLWRTRRPAWSTSPTPSTSSPPSSPPWPSCRSTSLNVFWSLNSMCRRSIQWCCAGPCGRLWWPLSSSSFASSPPSQCSGKIKTHASVDMSPSPIPINRHQKLVFVQIRASTSLLTHRLLPSRSLGRIRHGPGIGQFHHMLHMNIPLKVLSSAKKYYQVSFWTPQVYRKHRRPRRFNNWERGVKEVEAHTNDISRESNVLWDNVTTQIKIFSVTQ